jgi:hypothetical protein
MGHRKHPVSALRLCAVHPVAEGRCNLFGTGRERNCVTYLSLHMCRQFEPGTFGKERCRPCPRNSRSRLPYVRGSARLPLSKLATSVKSSTTLFATVLMLSSPLFGCGEEQPRQQAKDKRSGLAKPEQSDWLAMQDGVLPEIWLAEREEKKGVSISSADRARLRMAITDAAAKFKESPRMVANHAAQLEDMLRAQGGDETAVALIGTLTSAVAPGRVESFGAAGQQYVNMRKSGFTSEQAVEALSKRYNPRG